MNYHYEFAIQTSKSGSEDVYLPSRMVVDLRDVLNFWLLPESTGPDGQVFENITSIDIRAGAATTLYYPYKLFRALYQEVMNVSILKLPYPSEECKH